MSRSTFIVIHRYAGLLMAFFLLVAATTGIFLAFYNELDAILNPELHYVQTSGGRLSVGELVKQVEADNAIAGKAKVQFIRFPKVDKQSVAIRVRPMPEFKGALGFDWIYVNPHNGELLGTRQWGAWRFDRAHLMPLVYKLHYSLAMPRPWGSWLFGAAALIWFFDCFTGIYLTFPRRRKKFFKKWQKSWGIKWRSGAARAIRDSHIALSLWLWGMLLVLALSSVMFNLYREVYTPVVKVLMPYERVRDTFPDVADTEKVHNIGFAQAYLRVNEELAIWQQEANFSVLEVDAINYDANKHAYRYRVRSSLDLPNSYSQTRLYIDANDGSLLGREHAYHDAGNALTTWLAALHMGKVFGFWYQVFISFVAFIVVVVTITGIVIWWRKKKSTTTQAIKQIHTSVVTTTGGQ